MDKKQDTAGIIERLEAASGPDRKLDGEIFKTITPDGAWTEFDDVWHLQDPVDTVAWEPPPRYTSSIDAALSLVPEGWNWTIRGADVLGVNKPYALLGLPGLAETEAHGATPAIALVSAALRARAHKGER